MQQMKSNVLEKIYDATHGEGASMKVSACGVETTRVQVTDFSGNHMNATLQQVWDSILQFFEEGGEEPWCIHNGRMTISKPAKGTDTSADGKRQRQQRQTADAATKVRSCG